VSAARPLYLDYAATTPVDPRVAAAMAGCLTLEGDFGNASSGHELGRAAAARIEGARAQVAALVGADPAEIVFTSGATESNNLAILGVARANADRGRHLVTARTEHKAVLDPCKHLEKAGFQVTYLTPERSGLVPVAALAAALRPDTQLVSLMGVNNEIGVVQDLAAIGALCRERGVAFHSDCAQAAGKIALDVSTLPVDFLSFTAHKLYGPKGVGALYVRRGARGLLQPVNFGGGQEQGWRPGTLATHQIVGFGAACEIASAELPAEGARLTQLRERLWGTLGALGGVHLNGADALRVPGILNLSFEGVEGESLVSALPGLAVSTGAACNSASAEASYVLRALGRSALLAGSSLRFSLGRFTREPEVDRAAAAVARAVSRLRARSPAAGLAQALESGAADEGGAVACGEAGGPGEETWVRFHLLIAGDTVKEARVQAFGCPHTLDVADWICRELRGRTRQALPPGRPADWAASRGVPVEKLGRLLVIEDALRACLLHWP
jgi:cysteine desulfurase